MDRFTPDDAEDLFEEVYKAMCAGDTATLERVAETHPPFPHGQDKVFTRHWITHAVHASNYAAFYWVLRRGVEVNFVDDEGYSPLKSLLEMERQALRSLPTKEMIVWIDRLIEAGASVNFRHVLDKTPLHRAAAISSPAVVQHLLDRGADPHALDADYSAALPIHYARNSAWKDEVAAILRQAMKR